MNEASVICATVAGGRDLLDKSKYTSFITGIYQEEHVGLHYCGMASGGDTIGLKAAVGMNLPIEKCPADWGNLSVEPCIVKTNSYGRQYNALAGFIRNEYMASHINICVLLPGGKGTKDMEDRCIKHHVKIYKYKEYK